MYVRHKRMGIYAKNTLEWMPRGRLATSTIVSSNRMQLDPGSQSEAERLRDAPLHGCSAPGLGLINNARARSGARIGKTCDCTKTATIES